MILDFGAYNFYSFKEGVTISFEKGKKKQKNYEISKLLGIKGANGSGKTHVAKIPCFLSFFCSESFSILKPEAPIPYQPHFSKKNEPTELFIRFLTSKYEYEYTLSVFNGVVNSEVLRRKDFTSERPRYMKVVERKFDTIEKCIAGFDSLKNISLRSNASFICTARQHQFNFVDDVYDVFRKIIGNVSVGGHQLIERSELSLSQMTQLYNDSSDEFNFAKNIIINADLGVDDITIDSYQDSKGDTKYTPLFHLKSSDGTKEVMPFSTQSSGTQALFYELYRYHTALKIGGFLVLDEFDLYLHPEITPFLLDYFENENKNTCTAQILFVTHNDRILDYLGKYRSYLVAKDFNESYAYRLDEIPGDLLRNDRSILPAYKTGRIGGIPKL
jgi:hypothetical protein